MKINAQSALPTFTKQTESFSVPSSRTSEKATGYAYEQKIDDLQQQNIVDEYFRLFDQNYSDVAIKNLISARLQPAYQLPQIHDMQTLASKADKLLNFSLSI